MATHQYQAISQEEPQQQQEQQHQEQFTYPAGAIPPTPPAEEQQIPYGQLMADEEIVIGEYRVKWGIIRDVMDERGLAHTDENVISIILHAIMARQNAE